MSRFIKSHHMIALTAILAVVFLAACASKEQPAPSNPEAAAPNSLTEQEKQEGWKLLFDGQSFAGWRGIGRDSVPTQHWVIEDGTIHKIKSGSVPVAPDGQPVAGGDLMTDTTFENFELVFDWKISPGGNSGVKYNVSEELSTNNPLGANNAALGFEYQVLDDEKHEDAHKGNGTNRTSSALYDLIGPVAGKKMNPPGQWNQGKIVFQGNHGEHWLNGQKVLEYDLDSPAFDSTFAASKYAKIQGFRDKRSGHIVLQDHNDDAWYRNIKIRELPAK